MFWALSFSGLFLLLISGDFLVRGAIQLSNRIGISPLMVSLTIVAFGTSAPELIVAIKATLSGSPGLALGNVVGSNIANLGFVLAITLLFTRIKISKSFYKSDWPMMFISSILLWAFIQDCNISLYE